MSGNFFLRFLRPDIGPDFEKRIVCVNRANSFSKINPKFWANNFLFGIVCAYRKQCHAPALHREPRKKRRTRLMSRVMMLCALFFFFCVDEFVRFTPSLPLCHHLLHVKLLLELLRFCATFWMNMLLDTGRF